MLGAERTSLMLLKEQAKVRLERFKLLVAKMRRAGDAIGEESAQAVESTLVIYYDDKCSTLDQQVEKLDCTRSLLCETLSRWEQELGKGGTNGT